MRILLSLMLIFCFSLGHAAPRFFDDRARGWHWYERQLKQEKKEEGQERPTQTPTQILAEQKKDLSEALDKAILTGDVQDVANYMAMQKKFIDRSERFSNSWSAALQLNPKLDERVKDPVDHFARPIVDQENNAKREKIIKNLAKTHGLFFFFRGDCPYCHGVAPVVQAFAEKYGWEVMPISLDGSSLEVFPKPRRDNGIAENLGIDSVPALIAINPATTKVFPISFGMVSLDEMERRIEILWRFIEENQHEKI